jgi:hypothetical protein
MGQAISTLSPWQIRYDLVSIRALLALAKARGLGSPKPEVHLFLGDRYERLSNYYGRRGARTRAQRLADKARWHYSQAGLDDFPQAAAMAMPVPRPRIFTDARGRYLNDDSPDDAA